MSPSFGSGAFRMRNAWAAISLVAALSGGAIAATTPAAPKEAPAAVIEAFKSTYKNAEFDAIRPSEVDGIYEVYSGGRILYFVPKENILIFGEMYSSGGQSLTQAKLDKLLKDRVGAIDKSKALAIGQGPFDLVVFADPNCGYCRKTVEWLEARNYANVRALFFFADASQPNHALDPASDGYAKVMQAMCAPEDLRREAVRQIYMNPKPAGGKRLSCPEGEAQLLAQGQVAKSTGVSATPVFVVKDQTILGFRQDRLEALLSLSPTPD